MRIFDDSTAEGEVAIGDGQLASLRVCDHILVISNYSFDTKLEYTSSIIASLLLVFNVIITAPG